MNNKKKYGQFFTTNYKYILQNLNIPSSITHIIEPFCGNGNLLDFVDKNKYILECYDIESKHTFITKRDTLLNPPLFKNKFVLTNPPYLARNKSENKVYFDKYNTNDLYKCFITELLTNVCLGGILIIPLNFLSSIRKADINLREQFLKVYSILHLNIFEEQVFSDTTYSICSFQFELNDSNLSIPITIYPSNINLNLQLNDENNFTFGGKIYNLPQSSYKISRLLTSKDKNTNLVIKCIDDSERINLKYVDDNDIYIDDTPNKSCRTYATLVITPILSVEMQKELVDKFNTFLNEKRIEYHSLFLTNYRERNRKRISFDLVYSIVSYLLR